VGAGGAELPIGGGGPGSQPLSRPPSASRAPSDQGRGAASGRRATRPPAPPTGRQHTMAHHSRAVTCPLTLRNDYWHPTGVLNICTPRAPAGSQRQGRDRRAWLHPERSPRALRARGRSADDSSSRSRVRRARLGDLTSGRCRDFRLPPTGQMQQRRSPRPVRRTQPPAAGSPAPQRSARNARAGRCARAGSGGGR
jgi:hypothetical protein